MKKPQFYKKLSLIFLLSCLINHSVVYSSDFDLDDLDNYDLGENVSSVGAQERFSIDPATLGIDPANYGRWFTLFAATDLFTPTSTIKVKNLLINDFFKRSNSLITRNINNYPLALHYDYTVSEQDTLNLEIFLNKCSAKYLSDTGNTLEEVVDFDNTGLEDILATIDSLTSGILETSATLDLFAPGRVEERKMGGLFQYMRRNENWFLRIQVPFMYLERNLQFTQEQKDAIYNSQLVQLIAKLSDGNSPSQEFSEDQLARQHFIVDQIGFGNIHIGAQHTIVGIERFTLKLGEYVELPTEWAFKRGVKGTWFNQDNSNRYPLVMAAINPTLPITLTTTQQDMIAAFFVGSVDQMCSNILTTNLGNNNHTAIAIQTDILWQPFTIPYFQFYGAMQYELPGKEQRYFIKEAGDSYTNLLASIPNPGAATSSQIQLVVDGFAQELQDRLYPYVYTTTVQPGIMFNAFASMEIPYKKWHFSIGANGWYQAQETLFNIDAPSNIRGLLNTSAAQGFAAYQVKPFARIDYHCEHELLTTFSLYGDYTVANESTGDDFTINLQFTMKF